MQVHQVLDRFLHRQGILALFLIAMIFWFVAMAAEERLNHEAGRQAMPSNMSTSVLGLFGSK